MQMSAAKQRRMNDLLARRREGDLDPPHEERELEKLVVEAQLLTVEKAKRLLQKNRNR